MNSSLRRLGFGTGRLVLALSLVLASLASIPAARADSTAPSPVDVADESATDAGPTHRISLLARTSLSLHLSDARTAGGLGGGFGLRDAVGEHLLLQADIAWLTQLGNVLALRAGAGLQKPGTWSPAALVAVTSLFGSQLHFPAPGRPATPGPALSIGLILAPLRFVTNGAEVSLLEIGVGIGGETPGIATALSIGFEVGAQLF